MNLLIQIVIIFIGGFIGMKLSNHVTPAFLSGLVTGVVVIFIGMKKYL